MLLGQDVRCILKKAVQLMMCMSCMAIFRSSWQKLQGDEQTRDKDTLTNEAHVWACQLLLIEHIELKCRLNCCRSGFCIQNGFFARCSLIFLRNVCVNHFCEGTAALLEEWEFWIAGQDIN